MLADAQLFAVGGKPQAAHPSLELSPLPDELAGFITAVSLVKPGRSVHEVDTKSVRKKMKDKAFARSVSREDILNGAAELGVDLDQHIEFCIQAMQARAGELGPGSIEADRRHRLWRRRSPSPPPRCEAAPRS